MLRVLSAASKRVRPVPRAVALRSSGKGLAAATHFAIRSQPHSFAFPVVSTPFCQLHKSSAAFSVNPTTAELNFTHAISSLFRKIILGLEGMREVNPELGVKVESPTDLQIILGSRGTYQFQAELQDQSLYMLSPLSGTHIYKFDPENNWWTCTKDRHILFDLLTRELMKVCQGYPTL